MGRGHRQAFSPALRALVFLVPHRSNAATLCAILPGCRGRTYSLSATEGEEVGPILALSQKLSSEAVAG